jgi:pyruvate/2-oxoglutarate dehydrogenase complex dihydrolipoamide acyltransferase (E2) component
VKKEETKKEEPKKQEAPKQTKGKAPTTIGGTRTESRVGMSRMRIRIASRLKEA